MFSRHAKEFVEITSNVAVQGAMLSLSDETMLETREGWTHARDVCPGDALATLDGGFAPVSWISRDHTERGAVFVPAGAIDNCSDLVLPHDSLIGLEAPMSFEEARTDHVSLPLSSLEGYRGIRTTGQTVSSRTIGFESEEMLWAQTGLLVHARPMTDGFFHSLGFAETRGLIALLKAGHYDALMNAA